MSDYIFLGLLIITAILTAAAINSYEDLQDALDKMKRTQGEGK